MQTIYRPERMYRVPRPFPRLSRCPDSTSSLTLFFAVARAIPVAFMKSHSAAGARSTADELHDAIDPWHVPGEGRNAEGGNVEVRSIVRGSR